MTRNIVTGGPGDPLLPQIRDAIYHADEIELAVAFVKSSGLDLLLPALEEAVVERNARLTVLTSDYLDVTDPQALRKLMLFVERGSDVRVFRANTGQSFHLKTYIFVKNHDDGSYAGTAFVGSSNISRPALTDGIEWNYRVAASDHSSESMNSGFVEMRREFRGLLGRPEVASLDYTWIESYEKRRVKVRPPVAPGSDDPELPQPIPTELQLDALKELARTREDGYQRGLVVLATGLGKTFLAAFDSESVGAKRVLFVAHREEILLQAEKTFLRVHPKAKVGRFAGSTRDMNADMVFASVQTLGKHMHLEKFNEEHFDYVVVDEFHHAAAPTYRRLLNHFSPKFLLGLTATPERTDQSNILSLCDDNLVFERNLFYGVEQDFLCPFSYYGIYDETVDYESIPWRNGKFDPESLSNKLATLGRFKHVLREWKDKAQTRTLAFCVSKKHAQFMADRFSAEGIKAVAVYGGSTMARDESLELMRLGLLDVVFSVDLFSEGVDIPEVDTIMMLRPTDSKVLFIQQLGRGLRKAADKTKLTVLDFIGNHKGFLNKPQALFGIRGNHRDLAEFAKQVRDQRLVLPDGCYVNYDLQIIEFLIALSGGGSSLEYQNLKSALNKRPTLTEYYYSGASLPRMRNAAGSWWGFVDSEGDLTAEEVACLARHEAFFKEVEKTSMTKSFKAVLVESLLENNGFLNPPTVRELAEQARQVFRRRRKFVSDIHEDLQDIDHVDDGKWYRYWKKNPINAWVGGNAKNIKRQWFEVNGDMFQPGFVVGEDEVQTFETMLQQIVDYRLAAYENRLVPTQHNASVRGEEIPFFSDLAIACGHFQTGDMSSDSFKRLGPKYGPLQKERHFIAQAVGDSMNGGDEPVRNGDYLLLEHLPNASVDTMHGATVVVERPGEDGRDQFVLRRASAGPSGETVMVALNPAYPEFIANDGMRPVAKLRAVLDPLDLAVGEKFMREEIPALFGEDFNPGNWNTGHVVLGAKRAHILLVTINKQGKAKEHQYVDKFSDDGSLFYWQSQNNTTPEMKRGREIINHEKMGISVYLFVRQAKLARGKAAPFVYQGRVRYVDHKGSRPIGVTWEVLR